jgi:hypothetical protein
VRTSAAYPLIAVGLVVVGTGCLSAIVSGGGEMIIELPIRVRPLFVAAGWHPGRTIAPAADVSVDHPAAAILTEFGGLHVGKSGAGEECAKGDVAFKHLDPEEFVLDVWGKLLSTELVGIAEVHHNHAALYVDRSGRCFCHSIVDDGFYFEGSSFGEAIERVLLGRRSRPMLRPDQRTVWHYGEEISADDLRVYKYD